MIFEEFALCFWIIMLNPCFTGSCDAIQKSITFTLLAWQKLLANINLWRVYIFPSVFEQPILHKPFRIEEHQHGDPHGPVKCQADSNFPLSDLWLSLISSSKFLMCNSVAIIDHSWTHKSALPGSLSFMYFGSTVPIYHVNTVNIISNLDFMVNFSGGSPLAVKT